MLKKIGAAVLVGLLLFAAGWFVGRKQLEGMVADSLEATKARVLVADSLRAADSAEYAIRKRTTDARVAFLERFSDSLQRVGRQHARNDRALDSVLAKAKTAADSLPLVVQQRDEVRQAYALSEQRGDSLTVIGDSLKALNVAADSLLAVTRRSGLTRETALLAENAQLRIRIDKLQHGGKLFGLIPLPKCGPGYSAVLSTKGTFAHGPAVGCIIVLKL